MSKSKRSDKPIWLAAIVAFALWALFLAAAQPLRVKLAGELAQNAHSNSGAMRLADLKLASLLSPHYDGYRLELADAYLDQNNPTAALLALPKHGSEALRAKRASIELGLGHPDRAVDALQGLGSDEAAVLMSKAYLELNEPERALDAVKGRPGAAEQERLCQAVINRGGLALAYRLKLNNLPQSARRAALAAPDSSIAKFSLLADLTLQQSTDKRSIDQATAYLRQGLALDSSSLSLHRQLLQTLQLGKDEPGIQKEQGIIQALESGAV